MDLTRKLKSDRCILGALVPLSMLLFFSLAVLFFGLPAGLKTIAVMLWGFCLFYLYVFVRTGNLPQLVISLDAAFFGSIFWMFAPKDGMRLLQKPEFEVAYFTGLIFFGVILVFLALTRKLKWRGRELFELAAESVEEKDNGYTPRPRPVGKVTYSQQEMHHFARFCARNLIALPFYTSKNITLVPIKMGDEFFRLLGLSGDYRDATWVNFDVDGEVSVHITRKDYLDYREPLAFDQLCTSFGQLFIDFIELYNKGEGVRVIDRLDDLKLGIFN